MAVKVEYICDKCEASQAKPDQMWSVGVFLQVLNSSSNHSRPTKLWCRKCVDELDLLGQMATQYEREVKAKNETLPPKPPTLGEQLVEVLTLIAQDAVQN